MSATTIREDRRWVLGLVLALISVPVALALVEAVSFYVTDRNNGSIVSSGQKREYLLYVPSSYDRTRPTPLVISMHGGGLWPAFQMDTSGWNRLADEHGFIVVYPAGRGAPRVFPMDDSRNQSQMRDVRFISELIDTLAATYKIDPARIYADGLSNGGGMAFVLSCTLSHRIAAVGLVASAQLLPWSWCVDSRPVPMIAFHGTEDHQARYNGGKAWFIPNPLPSIPDWAAKWARRNRCDPKPGDSVVAADVTRRSYTNCVVDADVVLYTVQGGGHTWPGGGPAPEWFVGPTTRSIDATSQMWAFFREHPLREVIQ